MDSIASGLRVVENAETALRDLMRQQLDAGRYADLAPLARLADALAGLIAENNSGIQRTESQVHLSQERSNATPLPRATPPRSSRAGDCPSEKHLGYPRFHIANGWITKIGWSKRHQEQYEHHAPKEAAIALAHHIDGSASPGKIWTVESLGTVTSSAGDVPAYQIYLLIRWFRSLGALTKHGRNGYTSAARGGLEAVVESAFKDA